jgi:hypothetical protein
VITSAVVTLVTVWGDKICTEKPRARGVLGAASTGVLLYSQLEDTSNQVVSVGSLRCLISVSSSQRASPGSPKHVVGGQIVADPTLAEYAGQLAPAAYDRTEASTRRKVVEAALFASSLRVTSMFESGSWTHGTSITAKSDVDYMAVATGRRPLWPSSALAAAKTAVTGCDWKITGVRVSSPVIGITYHSQPHFEIAPAWYMGQVSGFSVYWIAGRGDEWVHSAPGAHLAYVNRQNGRLGKKVKPLVRLLKAWKHNVAAPVSSFYLEMRTAEYAAGEAVIVYDIGLHRVMSAIVTAGARDMNDPAHIVGRIPACASDEKRRRTLGLLATAIRDIHAADAARAAGDRRGYWLAMRQVFGSDYPWPAW